MAHRAGDNSQVLALGEALGWPFEVKRFVYNRYEVLVNWPFSSWLVGIDKSRSSTLSPPWPELIITAGRRNEPIARWIRNQAGHRVRVVHLGRPWAKLEGWDLVVTTPQYRLPRAANVLHNETSLHRIVPERLTDARAKWEPRLAGLPRPYIAVLVGGDSGPYPFDAAAGTRLGREASALAHKLGGSLLVTTSARTRLATTEALFAAIDAPSHCYSWRPNDTENPYFGFLGLADRIIASGDSVSMMTEACATGRPVYLFDTGEGSNSMRGHDGHRVDPAGTRPGFQRGHLKAWVYRQTLRYGPQRLTRDIRIIHRQLVQSGRAVWLGEGEPAHAGLPLRDLERAAVAVRALFQQAPLTEAAQPEPAPSPERLGGAAGK
jgi:mitochondrial fission protein ELM1